MRLCVLGGRVSLLCKLKICKSTVCISNRILHVLIFRGRQAGQGVEGGRSAGDNHAAVVCPGSLRAKIRKKVQNSQVYGKKLYLISEVF